MYTPGMWAVETDTRKYIKFVLLLAHILIIVSLLLLHTLMQGSHGDWKTWEMKEVMEKS